MDSSSFEKLKTTGLFDEDDDDTEEEVGNQDEESTFNVDQELQLPPVHDETSAHNFAAPSNPSTAKFSSPSNPSPAKKPSKTGLAKRKRTLDRRAAEDRNKPFKPIRDYYHSNSFIKFKDNEWEKDVDSDDEVDHSWRRRLEKSELHEFTDIPKIEKDMMQMWNAFVRSDTIIRSKSIPQTCLNFIEMNATKIRDEGLGEQLPWHLVNLWDEGLISSDHLSFCLDHYHNLASGTHIVAVERASDTIGGSSS